MAKNGKNDNMSEAKEPKSNSFELILAENIKKEERKKYNLIDFPETGLVVKEKISHSYPELKFYYVGDKGIVKLMKEIEEKKK